MKLQAHGAGRAGYTLPQSQATRSHAAAKLAVTGGAAATLLVGAAQAAEMTCVAIPNSPSLICTPTAAATPAPAVAHSSWLAGLGPVGHSAAVGAAVVGGMGAVLGIMMGGLPDNPPNPLGTGLALGAVGAVVGGVAGAAVGGLGILLF